MKKLIYSPVYSLFMLAFISRPVYAQTVPTIQIPKPSNVNIINIGLLISSLINLALIIAGIAAFAYLIWGGVQWITSGGDKGNVEAAQKRIQAAIVGLFVVFSAWAIMLLIQSFLGITIIGGGIPIQPPF